MEIHEILHVSRLQRAALAQLRPHGDDRIDLEIRETDQTKPERDADGFASVRRP